MPLPQARGWLLAVIISMCPSHTEGPAWESVPAASCNAQCKGPTRPGPLSCVRGWWME